MVETPAAPMRDPRSYLTIEQIKQIISACDNIRDKILFMLLARSGRRVSEIVRCLKPKDIDFENRLINYRILKKKGETRALLPVDTETLKLLKEYIKREKINENEFIFKISRQRVDQIFKKLCRKVGIMKIGEHMPHVHVLRHSFAIQWSKIAKNPADVIKLKEQLAHSRIDTTMFYLRFSPEESRDLLEKMWKSQ
jgi:integrase/recombinase XerD